MPAATVTTMTNPAPIAIAQPSKFEPKYILSHNPPPPPMTATAIVTQTSVNKSGTITVLCSVSCWLACRATESRTGTCVETRTRPKDDCHARHVFRIVFVTVSRGTSPSSRVRANRGPLTPRDRNSCRRRWYGRVAVTRAATRGGRHRSPPPPPVVL